MAHHDVVIIGAGPAGVAAAIQLNRFDIDTVVFEKDEIGGLLRNAYCVENYPGFPRGISGKKLVSLLKKQLTLSEIVVNYEQVIDVGLEKHECVVKTDDHKFSSRFAIVATGTRPKKLSEDLVPKEMQKQILYEIHPISNIKHKTVVVFGSGDAAFDYALQLSPKNSVHIVNRSNTTKCLPLLYRRCSEINNIIYHANLIPENIDLNGDKKEITCIDSITNEQMTIHSDYIVGAIGRQPNIDCISEEIRKGMNDFVYENKIYIIGDAHNGRYRQVGISVGDGLKTAMKIHTLLNR